MEIVHLRNLAFYDLVIPNCNTKDKTLTTNITKVTCKDCRYSQEGKLLEAERMRSTF
jgi:hypothetical protein